MTSGDTYPLIGGVTHQGWAFNEPDDGHFMRVVRAAEEEARRINNAAFSFDLLLSGEELHIAFRVYYWRQALLWPIG